MTIQTAEALYTQATYRVCLDVLARPGKIGRIGMPEGMPDLMRFSPYMGGIGLTLLDHEVKFHAALDTGADTERMKLYTMSMPAPIETCDYLFMNGADELDLTVLKRGDLMRPDDSCTVLCSVDEIGSEPPKNGDSIRLRLTGPGVQTESVVYMHGLSAKWISGFIESNQEYPLGLDGFFVDAHGRICAIPRSSRIKWDTFIGGNSHE